MLRVKGSGSGFTGGLPHRTGRWSRCSRSRAAWASAWNARGRFEFRASLASQARIGCVARLPRRRTRELLEYANIPLHARRLGHRRPRRVDETHRHEVTGRVVFDPVAPGGGLSHVPGRPRRAEGPPQRGPLPNPGVGGGRPDVRAAAARWRSAGACRIPKRGRWVWKAVMLGDQDITDTPTEFRPGRFRPPSGWSSLIAPRRSAAASTNDEGEPAWSTNVVLFSEDKASWFPALNSFSDGVDRTRRPFLDLRD